MTHQLVYMNSLLLYMNIFILYMKFLEFYMNARLLHDILACLHEPIDPLYEHSSFLHEVFQLQRPYFIFSAVGGYIGDSACRRRVGSRFGQGTASLHPNFSGR